MFAENAEAEILEPFRIVVKEQDTLADTYAAQARNTQKELKALSDKLGKSRLRYFKAHKDAEDTLYSCEESRGQPGSKSDSLERLNVKVSGILREHKEAEDAYRTAAQSMVEARESYRVTLTSIIEVLEKHEIKRVDMIKDSLQKLFLYEASASQVHAQDTKRAVSNLEEINAESDIHSLLHKEPLPAAAMSLPPQIQLEIKKSGWDRLFEFYSTYYYNREGSMDYVTLVEETKRYIMQAEDAEYKAYFSNYREFCFAALGEMGTVPAELADKCRTGLDVPKARIAFVHALADCIETHKSAVAKSEGVRSLEGILKDYLDEVTP